ncbi:hypothetical protein C8R41DRAFT_759783 [Lentinula lateritia]|uniref:XPG-I domain-containing protein n=1 Tax=Lentinula lateritia TaxID=40482 RepID=A0ABQ8VLS2_9AGAR|nr:hypothetical protein C8R41DRAFT_759783 [Lentinula lateritia]
MGAHCIFVFDGNQRPRMKRGHRVITHELDYQKHSKTMIKLFGYHDYSIVFTSSSTKQTIQAPDEAKVELVDMLKQGVIDTILSKDSDVFPLGANSVLKIIEPKIKGSRKCWEELEVYVYDAKTLQTHLGYSQAGLILISLLLHNDFTSGVNGIGRQTAHGLAQSGFGDVLLNSYQKYSMMPEQLSQAFKKLNKDMAHEIQYNIRGCMGSCSPTRARILRDSAFPTPEDLEVLNTFLRPVTSSSLALQPVPTALRLPTLPDIVGIMAFCSEHFAWSAKLTLEHFHDSLWPGVLIRMLFSVCTNSFTMF